MSRNNSQTVNYPDPRYDKQRFGPKLDLDALPDPPDDYNPLGYSRLFSYTTTRRPNKNDGLRWTEFYFWGIKVDWGRGPTLASIERAMRKLMWYTAPHHQPGDWDEMNAMEGDAGPRTVDYTKIPWTTRSQTTLQQQGLMFAPVSRYYPDLPGPSFSLPATFRRPPDAPAHWTDEMVYQSQQIVRRAANSGSNAPGASRKRRHRAQGKPPLTEDPKIENFQTEDSETEDDVAVPKFFSPPEPDLGPGARQAVQDAVERAIMNIAYSGLDRHPDAASRLPPRDKTATTEEEILRSAVCSTSANSHVRLRTDGRGQLHIDRSGIPWVLKGRGPVYTDDSSVVDCMITVGKMLDAGSTNADRSDPQWDTKLSRLQRAFIELSDANWDLCTFETGAQMKGGFVQILRQAIYQFGDQTPSAVPLLWKAVARHLGQVAFKFEQTRNPCKCTITPQASEAKTLCYMAPDFYPSDSTGVTMQALFERTFQARQGWPCQNCGDGENVLEKSFHTLPLRLAVTLDPRVSIIDHTDDITFLYRPVGYVEQRTVGVYRWIGGIYQDRGAYRVFWNDTRRGEVNDGRVCEYDSTLHGLIVSEEPNGEGFDEQPKHRVPPRWWDSKPVPLLFYERVLNPSSDVLKVALSTIEEMGVDQRLGVPTFISHRPWAKTEDMRRAKSGYPWQPVEVGKPQDAQYFQIASTPYTSADNNGRGVGGRNDMPSWNNNGPTLPSLRSTNLLAYGAPEDFRATSRVPSFSAASGATGPSRAGSGSTARGTEGGAGLSSGILGMGLNSPAARHEYLAQAPTHPPQNPATGSGANPDIEMLDTPPTAEH
ncbi:uncharacterized protein BJX67DRAFT_321244 [Aspergillus lucknowensis]|uniref:Uncharacterized protein n=1 Tax=Aspergillus lucknowensis TaxID=176173 RepID=A0ABR4LZ42_9EURO